MKLKPSKEELEALYHSKSNGLCCSSLGVSQKTMLRWVDSYGIKRKESPGQGTNMSMDKIVDRWWFVGGSWSRVISFSDDGQFVFSDGVVVYKDELLKLENRRF